MKLLKNYILKITITLFIFLISNQTYAQNKSDYSVKKITLLSTACPGLGQIYNKKYWKVPIIYTALGASIYYYHNNNNKYIQYKTAHIAETDENINTINNSGYSTANLITLQDYYRNNRDLSALMIIFIYFLNIIDASVDAHLKNYNLNDNLSLSLRRNNIESSEIMSLCLKWSL